MKPYWQLACTSILLTALAACGGSGDSSNENEISQPSPGDDETISQLLVNEIVASAEDEGNDWIELYALQGDIQLSDYSLVDDNSSRAPQTLPEMTLSEGMFVVIQAIDEEDTPPDDGLYVTFKLGSDDAVYLYKGDEQIDVLDWQEGEASEGTSFGLYSDGSSNAQTLMPTPGEANQPLSDEVSPEPLDTTINENAQLRINEIVAKQTNDADDWIELYASGSNPVNLTDYTLADENGELASLPDVSLAPGEFYRIYATTDESIADSVPFKLGSEDQVSLYLGTDLVDQLAWEKGQALIGYSFGRFPDGSDATRTLSPSPLAGNQDALAPALLISEVVANDENSGSDWFELYNNSAQTINLAQYQVIDESDDIEPIYLPDVTLQPEQYLVIYATNEETTEFSVNFKLGNNDELNLLLNEELVDYIEWDESDVVSPYSVGVLTPELVLINKDKDFLTPTPNSENELASAFTPNEVTNLFIEISDENWQSILSNPTAEEYHEASITLNGVTLDSVAMRTKGGSSLRAIAKSSSDRYSFKIDINEYVDGQKFFGLKKFTLQNSYNDPTYMREMIAYDLLEEMGVPTPKRSYVNVYINNDLFGFYLMLEAIDGEFLENHFSNSDGDMYKPDGTGSDLTWISDRIESYSDINPQTNEESTDHGAFLNFVASLDSGSTEQIDVDHLLRYMAVNVSLSNLDSYFGSLAHNYYLYEQDGKFTLLPWDFNESFGTFSMGCERVDVRELYIDEPIVGYQWDRPLVANVFANETYLALYHTYLWELINGSLQSDTFAERVNSIASLIDEHVENDPTAFYGYNNFKTNLTTSIGQFYGLTSFINYRVENMTKQLQGDIPSSSGNGMGLCN